MAHRNAAELAAGAVVLAVAIGFLGYAVAHTGRGGGSGDVLHAQFQSIDGLFAGADVRIAGVKVGSVLSSSLDAKTFQASVSFSVSRDIQLPKDSSAEISSDGLLGGKYLSLTPGGDTATIPNGGTVTITQSSINIEALLGKFIFSAANLADTARKSDAGPPSGSPSSAGTTAPAKPPAKPDELPPLGGGGQ